MKKIFKYITLIALAFNINVQPVFADREPPAQQPPGGGGNNGEINLDFGSAAKNANVPGTENFDPSNPQAGFNALISNLLEVLMAVAALMVFGYLIWGAYDWITSAGDKGKIETAQKKMTQAMIGILVLASTLAIFNLLQGFLGLNVFGGNN